MSLPMTLLSLLCHLLVLHAARVESYGHNWYNMFTFGDSFADNGNIPESTGEMARAWYFPYGISYKTYNGNQSLKPTGRFSDYMVESDLIARMLGIHEAPPAYQRTFKHFCHPQGMTFATAGAGVHEVPDGAPTLAQQVDNFQKLMDAGVIEKTRLKGAIFLVAISGNDYARTIHLMNNDIGYDITPYIANVTNEIAANVLRLQKLGVKKVLVNNMHPLGCTPQHTRPSNYTSCDENANNISSDHNTHLDQLLGPNKDALILDLNTAFTSVLNQTSSDEHSSAFTSKLMPCCEANDPKGFCGDRTENFEFLFKLDDGNVRSHFYWDDMHPTSAAWEAVMKQMEGPIKEFLAQEN